MLNCKHSKFTLPPAITYLNCAYMAPLPKKVEKEGLRGLRLKRNPVAIAPDDFFSTTEKLREEFSKTIHAEDPSRIVIVPSVSYGMATVARNVDLRPGQNIIVASEQFPSNYYVWKQLCDENNGELKVISPGTSLSNRGKEWNQRILEAITKETRMVALGHVHWADGTKFDLEEIRKRTRDVGALLIIDGTQSVGALPFDVRIIQPDALVCAGYKWLLGPYSIGLAYFGPYFNDGKPLEENWINRAESSQFNQLVNYKSEYQPGALRYEVGEHSNFILVPMMLRALELINQWQPANIQQYCESISAEPIKRLRESGYHVEDRDFRGAHLFGVRPPSSVNMDIMKANLLKKKIYVSFRGDAIRISPNVYNTAEELDRLVSVLIR